MNVFDKRLAALERVRSGSVPRWHYLRRYEHESETDAIAVYEADNGPIEDGNVVMRVIISKPGERPVCEI